MAGLGGARVAVAEEGILQDLLDLALDLVQLLAGQDVFRLGPLKRLKLRKGEEEN